MWAFQGMNNTFGKGKSVGRGKASSLEGLDQGFGYGSEDIY